MKKIIILLVAGLLLAAGFFGYRYYLAAERLRAIAGGGEYRALGFKLSLAPPSGGVKGLFRLQPYIEIPQVSLEAESWGGKIPLQLGKGRLKTDLWDSVGLRLVLDAGNASSGEIEFERLAFELGLPDQILSISAHVLRFPGKAAESSESLSVQEPWLQLRPGEGKIPSQLNLRFEAATWEDRHSPDSRDRVQVGTTDIGYALKPEGANWNWRAHFHSKGLASESRKVQGELKNWNFAAEGVAARWDEATRSRWREMWDALPGSPEGKLMALPATLSQLRPRIDRVEFRWAGLDFKEAEKWRLQLEPVEFNVAHAPATGGFGWKLKGLAKSLAFSGDQRRLELAGMSFEESLDYRGLSYEQWIELAVRYYSATYGRRTGGEGTDFSSIYLPYIAQLPDLVDGKFGIERMSWSAPGFRTEHRKLKADFAAKEDVLSYRLSADFDSHADSGFPPNVKDGKIDFNFAFPMPYREIVAAARSQPESAPSANFFASFAEKDAGVDWKWKADLGPESFGADLNLSALTKVDSWIATLALFGAFHRERPENPQELLSAAKVDLHLKIDRLSKLQAIMERIKSGASLALGLAGAYVVVDPKADTLSLDFKMEEGRILLNGKRNESLEALLQKQVH